MSFQRNHKPAASFAEYATQRKPVRIFLHERPNIAIDAIMLGVDEFMNLVLDRAVEVHLKNNTTTPLGKMMLKSDCIAIVAERSTMQ